jgi:hypothetical protein
MPVGKYGVGSDMRLTVATNKASRAGSPIAVASSAIGIGRHNPVTDQPVAPITSEAPPQPPTVCQCAICGRRSLWIDPFPTIPRQWRRGAVQKICSYMIANTLGAPATLLK